MAAADAGVAASGFCGDGPGSLAPTTWTRADDRGGRARAPVSRGPVAALDPPLGAAVDPRRRQYQAWTGPWSDTGRSCLERWFAHGNARAAIACGRARGFACGSCGHPTAADNERDAKTLLGALRARRATPGQCRSLGTPRSSRMSCQARLIATIRSGEPPWSGWCRQARARYASLITSSSQVRGMLRIRYGSSAGRWSDIARRVRRCDRRDVVSV